jgi:hypothetical protein
MDEALLVSIKDVVELLEEEAVVHRTAVVDAIRALLHEIMIGMKEAEKQEDLVQIEVEEEVDLPHHLFLKKKEIEELSLFHNWQHD